MLTLLQLCIRREITRAEATSWNRRVFLRSLPAITANLPLTKIPQRTFWILRGGASKTEEPSATDDVSKKRPLVDSILNSYPVSVCSIRGFRNYMEDEFFVSQDFCAVFDGHGGKAVSRYLRQNLYADLQAALPRVLQTQSITYTENATSNTSTDSNVPKPEDLLELEEFDEGIIEKTTTVHASNMTTRTLPTVEDYKQAMRFALYKVDREVQRISHWSYQGSTSVTVWFHETKSEADNGDVPTDDEKPQQTIVISNIGDSRAVLSRESCAVELTRDHKPNDPVEWNRIYKLGGFVQWFGDTDAAGEPIQGTGIYRVNGNLALSRAIGDRSERPAVTAEPDIAVLPICDTDHFIVLATDGLWDVMDSADVVTFIHELLDVSADVAEKDDIASMLVEEALRRGSFDNITVIIIWLNGSLGNTQ